VKQLLLVLLLSWTALSSSAQTRATGSSRFSGPSILPAVLVSWSFVQSAGGGSCTSGSTTCTFALNPTTANSVLAAYFYSSTSLTISSVALTGCGTTGTWIGGSGSSYQVFGTPSPGNMAWAYNITNGGGCTGATVTLSGTPGAWEAGTLEFTRSSGAPTLDALATTNTNTSSCTSCTGSSFTSFTGTRDLLIQFVNDGSGTGSPSAPYIWDPDSVLAYALNSTQLTAPTWTQSSGGFQSLGAAFK
jgi:hypothetical protein